MNDDGTFFEWPTAEPWYPVPPPEPERDDDADEEEAA